MGSKTSPRAIGFSAGLQLPLSIILALQSRAESRTIRARRNKPGGLFVCFVRALDPARDCGGDRAWNRRSTVEVPPDLCTFDAKVLR
jgi:hypothetical protein